MLPGKRRWRFWAAIALACVLVITGILSVVHIGYHRWEAQQDRVIVCSDEFAATSGPLAGCRVVPCTEVLASGAFVFVSFAYC